MRRFLLLTSAVVVVSGFGAGTAQAVCDPDYRPLCLSPCITNLPGRVVAAAQQGTVPSPLIGACPR